MGFAGKVAIVTGSASGIGRQTASRLAERGAAIVVNDVDATKLESTIAEFKKNGWQAIAVSADISKRANVDRMGQETIAAFGRIDILANNAGLERAGPLRKLSEADWDVTVDVNLKGAFLCSQGVHGQRVEKKYGPIINISPRAWLGGAGQAPYSSAKAGLVGLTRTLTLELGRHGITGNCTGPGLIPPPT